MKLEILTLCDSAEIKSHSLSLIAATDRIWSERAPGQIPKCSLAFRVRFDATEIGEHSIIISLIEQDGKALLPANKKTIIAKLPENFSTCVNIGIVNLAGIILPKFGEYSLDFIVDGILIGSQPVYFGKNTQSSGHPAA